MIPPSLKRIYDEANKQLDEPGITRDNAWQIGMITTLVTVASLLEEIKEKLK